MHRELPVNLRDFAAWELVMSVVRPAGARRTGYGRQRTNRDSSRHAQGLPAFRALAKRTQGPLADSSSIVDGSLGIGSGAWGFPRIQGPALGVRQTQADGGS